MNWRGRTVEYSGDPAKRPLVEVSFAGFGRWLSPLPDLSPGAASVKGKVLLIRRLGVGRKQPHSQALLHFPKNWLC